MINHFFKVNLLKMCFNNLKHGFSQLQDKSILISKPTEKISTENHFLTTNDMIEPFFMNITN